MLSVRCIMVAGLVEFMMPALRLAVFGSGLLNSEILCSRDVEVFSGLVLNRLQIDKKNLTYSH